MIRKHFILTTAALFACALSYGGVVNTFKFDNGLMLIHKEISDNPLVTFQIFSRGGSINEQASQAGLAQFTQGLLMQGTKKRNAEQLARDLEDIGAMMSSDISNDFSTLGVSCLDENAEKSVEILCDIAFNPAFEDKEIEKERPNIVAAIKARQDRIFQAADDIFIKAFYGDHPYSWPDLGKAETVPGFTRKDIENWHREHFAVNNMVLVVFGKISFEKTKSLAAKYFSAAAGAKVSDTFKQAEPPKKQLIKKKLPKFKQAFLMIGFPAPRANDRDYAALKVINAILGGRMSGRLFTELREKLSLAYEVNSFYPSKRELSRFVVYMGLEAKNLELAKKRIFELLDELKQTPVSETELSETKNFIRGNYLLDHQTIGRKSWYCGWWEIMGAGYAYDEKYLDDLMAVSASDIREAANKYFSDKFVQVEIVPENN
ncbi:MAG TPA: hypothetical protein DEE98_02820 [Elusimicrobia bacterium]|nr:MAG: hypothetical protein A2278_07650 [Elusimicrobia bacterium RIFOXYA12_FULL_49_49]OGS10044.1 MAG: hypothetical protein A2204_08095 [Elusimicrobia bacterium RIFOXYA1_FULL_47_7]OGS16060.1 MAG: hypothetical protein A2251_02615 [Elusimicrobia bacterium RIFOXYA2_FULL_47_53]OGS26686.1 MAG: hypothetical protein A2339_03665 [Elusimicrobia bacterium RIFOXYB12_FULL_50_12]OGS30188.1 MAG: hypothetical protein A2323_01920 [Elusimicrobia bacterium RIFOXYB2_FULL_46_23]HBU69297.1 hypothetical protein [El